MKKIAYFVLVAAVVFLVSCKPNEMESFELDLQGTWEFTLTEGGKTIVREYRFVGAESTGVIFYNQEQVGIYGAAIVNEGFDTMYTVSNLEDEVDTNGVWAEIYYGHVSGNNNVDSGNYTRTGDKDVSGTFKAKKKY